MTDCFRSIGRSNWEPRNVSGSSAGFLYSRMAWTRFGQGSLAIPESFPNAVSYQSALKANRLPGRCRKLQTRRILKHPADLLLGRHRRGKVFVRT
jgi:hypothetical protein